MTARSKFGGGAIIGACLVTLSACGGSGSPPGVATDATGIVSLSVSDGPVHDATKVCVSFDEIEFKQGEESTVITLDPAESVNLLDFQGMNAAPILVNQELAAGEYQWVRLGVDAVRGSNGGNGDSGGAGCDGEASYVVMEDGGVYNLYIPSGAQSGLKLVGGFTVIADGIANFTAEIDLQKSLKAPPGLAPDMMLRPTIRLVNNDEAGALTGQVANELATAESCEPSVYVFADGVTPNPIGNGDEPDPDDPVATALVEDRINDEGGTEFHYTVGFLEPGDYEAAFTCDGENFEPEAGKPAAIVAKEVTIVDF